MVPILLTVLVLALVLRNRERKMITAALQALARNGRIAPEEVTPLANLGKRRRWRRNVRRRSAAPRS